MARSFDDLSSQYLVVDSAPVTGAAFTMAAWARSSDTSANQYILALTNNGQNGRDYYALLFRGAAAGDPVAIEADDGNGTMTNSSTGFSANVWYHVCGVVAAANDRAIFLSGGSKGTSSVSRTPAGVNRFAVGALADSTPGNYLAGQVAEVGIWNVALLDEEVAQLAKGLSPLLVRPNALVGYWPLMGYASPEIDLKGRRELTLTNGPGFAVHPRVYGVGPRVFLIGVPAAGGAAQFDGTATLAVTTAGALTTAIEAAGTAALAVTTAAALTTAIEAAGSATLALATAGALETSITAAAAAAAAITTAGDLTTAIEAAGTATAAMTATGALTTAIEAAGTATLVITATADLTAGASIDGTATVAIAATGTLTTSIEAAATASVTVSASGALTTAITLAGTPSAVVTTAAALTTEILLAGAAPLVVVTAGDLATAITLATSVAAAIEAQAGLTTAITLVGAATVAITVAADLTGGIELPDIVIASTRSLVPGRTTANLVPGRATTSLLARRTVEKL